MFSTTQNGLSLSNLIHIYQEAKLLAVGEQLMALGNSMEATPSIYEQQVFHFLSCIYQTSGEYLHANGDLCRLSCKDRSIILRSAADNVTCVGAIFAIHQCRLFDLDMFTKTMSTIYGERTVELHRQAAKFIDTDLVLIKLAISLFAVSELTSFYSPSSSPSTMFTDTRAILQIQNKYAEVTWKYLLGRHGHRQAVKIFLNVTRWFLAISACLSHSQSLLKHTSDLDDLVENTELALLMDGVDS